MDSYLKSKETLQEPHLQTKDRKKNIKTTQLNNFFSKQITKQVDRFHELRSP